MGTDQPGRPFRTLRGARTNRRTRTRSRIGAGRTRGLAGRSRGGHACGVGSGARVRRPGACGPWRGGRGSPRDHRGSSSAPGSRACACDGPRRVDTCVSWRVCRFGKKPAITSRATGPVNFRRARGSGRGGGRRAAAGLGHQRCPRRVTPDGATPGPGTRRVRPSRAACFRPVDKVKFSFPFRRFARAAEPGPERSACHGDAAATPRSSTEADRDPVSTSPRRASERPTR